MLRYYSRKFAELLYKSYCVNPEMLQYVLVLRDNFMIVTVLL